MTVGVCQSVAVQASDIEIYKSASAGETSILLMLDTSGSMGISSLVLPKKNKHGSPGDVEDSLCDRVRVPENDNGGNPAGDMWEWTYNLKDTTSGSPTRTRTSIHKTVNIGGTTISYYIRGCSKNGVTQYDRLSRLKDAILPLLASDELTDSTKIGLGQFSSKTELTIGSATNVLTDGHSGRILVPNAALETAQRIKIAREIAAIKSLDTTTNEDGTSNTSLKLSSRDYPNVTKASGGTPTVHAYAEAAAYMMGTHTGTEGLNKGKVGIIYDGYMVKQQADNDGQVYLICVELGSGTTTALGATVRQCPSNWPSYDTKAKSTTTSSIVYKPNGSDWLKVTPAELKTKVGDMNRLWDVYTKLPIGWRLDGWMKVANEPMDIEPVVGTVWGYGDGIRGLVSYRTSPFFLKDGVPNNIGGFAYSKDDTKHKDKDGKYIKYVAGGSDSSCNGNGIYFLTDGAPNSTNDTMARTIMNTSLKSSAYAFSAKPSGTGTLISPALQSNLFAGETGGWEYIGAYAKKLFDKTKNPAGMQIKTAVVGFGSSFSGIPKNTDGIYDCEAVNDPTKENYNPDAYNACKWGGTGYGEGGFYYAENSEDIKNSIIKFVKNVTPDFESVTTGSPTLPQDALNPLRIQPYGYYAAFEPKPSSTTYQLWAGNLNKYHIKDGQLYGSDQTTKLFKADGTLNTTISGIWVGGVKQQLPLGISAGNPSALVNRTIYTNREIDSKNLANEANQLNLINFGSDFLNKDPKKNYWLNLLGYNVQPTDTITLDGYIAKTPTLRQVGATMHSTPILLTQEGTIGKNLDTTNRKDYLLFGSTQGLLHVVDKDGKEVFAFAPHEMMERQSNAFLSESKTTGDGAFYGIDAPWIAYTQYVANSNGSLTVGKSNRSTSSQPIVGKQWVYGGLRMGGHSYYALDLTHLADEKVDVADRKPVLKFHIQPEETVIAPDNTKTVKAKIINSAGTTSVEALSYMGQSWSKPTVAYVKFGGVKKLVMFVGGGYDAEYEKPSYDQNNKKGAGVYMFDAENGDLLWWSGANATSKMGAQAYKFSDQLQYSVVSQINAIDRDNDGLVDNLYFGDLGGQAFRIDLNNMAKKEGVETDEDLKAKFSTRIVRLIDQHVAGGESPRFYEMPSFSVHRDSTLGLFGVLALSSGDRSSPLSGAVGGNGPSVEKGASASADDGIFVVYDKDIGESALYANGYSLKTKPVALSPLKNSYAAGVAVSQGGWFYRYGNGAGKGVYKGMNSVYAVDSILYANVFHRDGVGVGGNCGAGVKGDSYLYRFCLPTGNCTGRFDSPLNSTGEPDRVKLGVGIVGSGLGSTSGGNSIKNTVPNGVDCKIADNKNKIECQEFTTAGKIRQLRWYETR